MSVVRPLPAANSPPARHGPRPTPCPQTCRFTPTACNVFFQLNLRLPAGCSGLCFALSEALQFEPAPASHLPGRRADDSDWLFGGCRSALAGQGKACLKCTEPGMRRREAGFCGVASSGCSFALSRTRFCAVLTSNRLPCKRPSHLGTSNQQRWAHPHKTRQCPLMGLVLRDAERPRNPQNQREMPASAPLLLQTPFMGLLWI